MGVGTRPSGKWVPDLGEWKPDSWSLGTRLGGVETRLEGVRTRLGEWEPDLGKFPQRSGSHKGELSPEANFPTPRQNPAQDPVAPR